MEYDCEYGQIQNGGNLSNNEKWYFKDELIKVVSFYNQSSWSIFLMKTEMDYVL